MSSAFKALGTAGVFAGLETFPAPDGALRVTLDSDEVTAVCPVTGQPDWYRVEVTYVPGEKCVESKSLKLYLQSFRDEGVFCEALAARIAQDIGQALACPVEVTTIQKRRGGIRIHATARWGDPSSADASPTEATTT